VVGEEAVVLSRKLDTVTELFREAWGSGSRWCFAVIPGVLDFGWELDSWIGIFFWLL